MYQAKLTLKLVFGNFRNNNLNIFFEKSVYFSKRHFIPENFKYDYEVDSKDTIKGHFEKFFSQNTNITVIIYIHGRYE